ncbi:MAG: hypothetical protein ABIB79_02050 [archaeon]
MKNEKIRELLTRRQEIVRRIRQTTLLKGKVENRAKRLNQELNLGEVSKKDYERKKRKYFENKTPQQWFDYYHDHNQIYQSLLANCEKKIRIERQISFLKWALLFLVILGLGGGLAFFVYLQTKDVLFAPPPGDTYIQELGIAASENMNYSWKIYESGEIRSVMLSGSIEGEGRVKVYLVDEDREWLVLDSSKVDMTGSVVTGFAVEEIAQEPEVPEINETDNNQTSNISEETTSLNITQEETDGRLIIRENKTEVQEIVEEPEVIEIELPIKQFIDECEETCDLTGLGLNKSSYVFRIEVDDAILKIDKVSYELFVEEAAPKIPKGTIQYKAVINQPVKWVRIVDKTENLSKVELPKGAKGIEISVDEEVEGVLEEARKYGQSIERADKKDLVSGITGAVIQESDIKEKIVETEDSKVIDLEDVESDTGEIAIEYVTEGPVAVEEETDKGKRLTISAPDEVGYRDVLAYTEVSEVVTIEQKDSIKVYWQEEDKFVDFEPYDLDKDGKVDYIEWIVPHLSNQTFDIYIEVLNVQSYPMVGGNWTVEFTTVGQADLMIRTIDGTTWSNETMSEDLKFLEIKCGDEILEPEWIGSYLFVRDYECEEIGKETSLVLTPGKHHLEFDFGGVKATAHNQAEDFKIQRGYTIMNSGSATATITAGVNYGAPTGPAFIRIVNTKLSGMGRTASGGNQNSDDFTVYISNPANIGTSINFQRLGTVNNDRISWEIIEYTGPVGGANEIQVRSASSLTFVTSSLTATTSTITGIADDNDIIVFITGQVNPDTGRGNSNQGLHTSEWLPGTDQARFTRGASGSASRVSYAIVEFVGANWKIQRVDHQYTVAGSWQTKSITPVNALNKAFLHTQHRSGNNMNGLDELGEEAYLFDISTIRFQLEPGATTPSLINTVAWVIENTQLDGVGIPMNVLHQSGVRPNNVGDEEDTWYQGMSLNPTVLMTTVSIMGENSRSSGTGTALPRGFNSLQIIDLSTVELKRSDNGQVQTYRYDVVEWPTAALNQPPNIPEGIYYDDGSCPTGSVDTGIKLEGHHDISGIPDPDGDPVTYYLEAFYTQGSCSNKVGGDCGECDWSSGLCTDCLIAGCSWEGGLTDIFFDNFETGGLSNWEQDSQNDWFGSTQRSYGGGTTSAEVDGAATNAWLRPINTFDLSSYLSATVSAQIYIESGLDLGEYVCMDYSCNGGLTWNMNSGGDGATGGLCQDGNRDTENVWREVTIDVNTVCGSLPSNFWIRFRGSMNGVNEDANVDYVRINADVPNTCEGTLTCSGLSQSNCEACSQCEWAGTQDWYPITPIDNHPEGGSVDWDTSSILDQSGVLFRVMAEDDEGLSSEYFEDTCSVSISHLVNLPPSDPDSITCDGGICNFPVDASVTVKAGGSVDPNLGDTITYYFEAEYDDGTGYAWRPIGSHLDGGSIVWTTSTFPPQSNVHFRAWAEDDSGAPSGVFTPTAPPYLTIDHTVNSPPSVNIKSVDNVGEYDLSQADDAVDLTPQSYISIEIVFDVTDSNGFEEIDDNSLVISYDGPGGEYYEGYDADCTYITDDGLSTKTYYCDIDNIPYFDPYGTWSATIDIQDIYAASGQDTKGFQVNILRSISLSTEPINFDTVIPGDSNILSTSSTTISNDGNADIPGDSKIQITSGDLCAVEGECIPGGDAIDQYFQADDITDNPDFCQGTDLGGISLRADQPSDILNINYIPKSTIFGVYNSEDVSFCFKQVPTPLGAYDYSTTNLNGQPWIISIVSSFWIVLLKIGGLQLLAAGVYVRRKKLKKEELLQVLDENIEDILELVKENRARSKAKDLEVPVGVFNQGISPAEAVSKYLKENHGLRFSEIAILVNRDQRTVRVNYLNAVKKKKEKIREEGVKVPINIFSDRKLSVLESVVKYLKDQGMNNSDIAKALGKRVSNIGTLRKRVEGKIGK